MKSKLLPLIAILVTIFFITACNLFFFQNSPHSVGYDGNGTSYALVRP